jgi:hypothetical protein
MTTAVACLAIAACGSSPAPAPRTPSTPPVVEEPELVATTVCAVFGYKTMQIGASSTDPAYDAAEAAATGDAEAAQAAAEKGNHLSAARHYVDCARRFRAVAATSALRSTATYNAKVCYDNALYAFANAGKLAEEGRGRLEQAAHDDSVLAAYITGLLEDAPADCAR